MYNDERAGVGIHSGRASVQFVGHATLARREGMISASLRYFVSHAGAWEREITGRLDVNEY